jgi:hypothetical protein
MKVQKPVFVGVVAALTLLLMYPAFYVATAFAGMLVGCSDNPAVWFCGMQGVVLLPALYWVIMWGALTYAGYKYSYLMILLPTIALVGIFYLCGNTISTLGFGWSGAWLIFALLAGLLFAGMCLIVPATKLHKKSANHS